MRPPGPTRVVRGQYGPGYVEGKKVPGYRAGAGSRRGLDDRDVRRREALRRQLALGRTRRSTSASASGCRSARRRSRSSSSRAPHPPFAKEAVADGLEPNVLLVHVQPDEGVSLAIGAKVPGQGMNLRTVHMDFLYGGAFRTELPEAYERLILDCLLGDATLFTRADEVDEQWALVDSIVAAWKRDRTVVPELRGGHLGAGRGRRSCSRRDGRAVAPTLRDTSVAEIEGRLDELRDHEEPSQRTSVLTHTAWVPLEWARAADRVLEGMGAARPVPDDPAAPRPERETRLDRRRHRARVLSRRRARRLRRDRADLAARRHREGARERRRPAADPRPAGLPALARQAPVRLGESRRSSSASATG